ncbi:MAG: copper amine oxidase N-terminal domain-containing protein [Peptococcaceae bacterium]|nr:copper amine oxidase N-terminal domain-containing protein [Peptococcaceae bacterium]
MKRCWKMGVVLMVLVLGVCVPGAAEAATVDINGHLYDTADSAAVCVKEGTTLISEQVLSDAFYLSLTRDGDAYTLTNAYEDFRIEGHLGERTFTMDGEEVALPVAAQEKKGVLYLPLRALAECFGYVNWYGDEAQTLVRFDYNDLKHLPEAARSEEALTGDFVGDAAIEVPQGHLIAAETAEGPLYLTLDEKGFTVALGTLETPFIRTQHEGYHLHAYWFDEDYFYWWEYPLKEGATTSYLYMQSRAEGAQPVLLAECGRSYTHLYGKDATACCNGNVLWAAPNAAGDELALWLYRSATGDTEKLDSMPLADSFGATIQVALDDHRAVWSTCRHVKQNIPQDDEKWALSASYGDLKCYDLATGTTTNLSQGYNLIGPALVGDYLLVQTALQEGESAQDNDAFWVYDLANERWCYQVRPSAFGIDTAAGESWYLMAPMRLDDDHVALSAAGLSTAYTLPVLDLASGTVHPVQQSDGAPLLCHPDNALPEELDEGERYLDGVQPLNALGHNLATVRFVKDGERMEEAWPLHFEW